MKKISTLLIFLTLFSSCEEDIRLNNPSMQALKDNVFWRATNTTARLNADGSLMIEGQTRDEIFQLEISDTATQLYALGTNLDNNVTYKIASAEGQFVYETGTNTGSGQIVITEFDTTAKTVSGTFRCSVTSSRGNPLVGNSIIFREGVFYKIPIVANMP